MKLKAIETSLFQALSRELPLLKFVSQCMSLRQTLAKASIQPG